MEGKIHSSIKPDYKAELILSNFSTSVTLPTATLPNPHELSEEDIQLCVRFYDALATRCIQERYKYTNKWPDVEIEKYALKITTKLQAKTTGSRKRSTKNAPEQIPSKPVKRNKQQQEREL